MMKTKRPSTCILNKMSKLTGKKKGHKQEIKRFLTKSEGCRDGRLAMGLPLVHNVNQQEGNTEW